MYKFRKDLTQEVAVLEREERVKGALRYAMTLVGMKAQNMPTDSEKQVLVDFVIRNFGEHTAEEVQLAFDMAVSGQLDVDATAYENFSAAFFGRVMLSYRKWATQEHEQQSPQIEQKHAKIEPNTGEAVDWSFMLDMVVNDANNGQIYKSYISTDLYNWLINTGRMNPSKIEKLEAFRSAAAQYKFEMECAVFQNGTGIPSVEIRRRLEVLNRDIYEEIVKDELIREAVSQIARQILVREYVIDFLSNQQEK